MDNYKKIVVERDENAPENSPGFVAYPVGLNLPGAVIGQGETPQEALADVLSAIEKHSEKSGRESPPTKKDCIQLTCADGTLLANVLQNGSTREVIVVGQCPCCRNSPKIPLQECRQLAESLLTVLNNQ